VRTLQELNQKLSGTLDKEENVVYNWIRQGVITSRLFREYIKSRTRIIYREEERNSDGTGI